MVKESLNEILVIVKLKKRKYVKQIKEINKNKIQKKALQIRKKKY